LHVVGIVQEQHPERAALLMQWRRIKWPVLVDSLNLTGEAAVPRISAVDEHGVVRIPGFSLDALQSFLRSDYPRPAHVAPRVALPDMKRLASLRAPPAGAAAALEYGDLMFNFGGPEHIDRAVEAYESVVRSSRTNTRALFRLGVTLQRRSEMRTRRAGLDVGARDAWRRALAGDSGQYIWRRRLQQYGATGGKPYSFYAWVEQARREIRARGETPVKLTVELTGPERAK
jgi:hypothetical protein